jgi:hypothetical protein
MPPTDATGATPAAHRRFGATDQISGLSHGQQLWREEERGKEREPQRSIDRLRSRSGLRLKRDHVA